MIKSEKLYIIGNGFDIHHGLHCSFTDFRLWLKENRPEVYSQYKRIYSEVESNLWSDFEQCLFCFNLDDYPYDVTKADLEAFKAALYEAIKQWVRTIGLPDSSTIIENIDKDALFITFNYTRTLEDLYGIDEDRVLHIHGSVKDDRIVFGHGSSKRDRSWYEDYSDEYKNIMEETEEEKLIRMSDEFIDVFKKPVAKIIKNNRGFFDALRGVKEISIFGFSYSDIDMPYLEKIVEMTGDDVYVIFGHHTFMEFNRALRVSYELGVSARFVDF